MTKSRDLLTMYDLHQKALGLSANTSRRRAVSLGLFLRFIHPASVETASTELVEEWFQSIRVAATRKAYRSDLSAFYTWACRRKLVKHNPVEDTDRIRVPRGLPRPVPVDVVRALIELAPDRETEIAIALAAYAGLRRAEVAGLSRDDLVFGTPSLLYVRNGKGGRDRVIPMHPDLEALLRRWTSAGLVCGHGEQAIGKKVAAHMRSLGINATMHQLRHTFATEAARVSPDLLAVRELLGHSSLATTERYTMLSGGRTAATIAGMYGAA